MRARCVIHGRRIEIPERISRPGRRPLLSAEDLCPDCVAEVENLTARAGTYQHVATEHSSVETPVPTFDGDSITAAIRYEHRLMRRRHAGDYEDFSPSLGIYYRGEITAREAAWRLYRGIDADAIDYVTREWLLDAYDE